MLEALARFPTQQPWRPYYVWFVRIFVAFLLCIATLSLIVDIYPAAIAACVPLVFVLPVQRISDYFIRRRISHSPELDAEYKFGITEEGISAKSANAESVVRWSGYSRAVFFPDGVLILHGTNAVTWLKDEAFENADEATQFRHLVSAKLPTSEFVS